MENGTMYTMGETGEVGRDPEALEAAADRLLAACNGLGRDSGIYTQTQLDRKVRLEQQRLPRLEEGSLPEDVICELAQRWLDELIEVSNLTAREEVVYRLHISGLKCRDTGATLQLRHQVVAACLRTAKRKVRDAYNEGRYAGWYEVYLSEVNRTGCRSK